MQIEQTKSPCRLRVGTSGYSYAEWVNAGFYPPGTRSDQMLPLYAQTFPITELNFTWYQMPKAAAISDAPTGSVSANWVAIRRSLAKSSRR